MAFFILYSFKLNLTNSYELLIVDDFVLVKLIYSEILFVFQNNVAPQKKTLAQTVEANSSTFIIMISKKHGFRLRSPS